MSLHNTSVQLFNSMKRVVKMVTEKSRVPGAPFRSGKHKHSLPGKVFQLAGSQTWPGTLANNRRKSKESRNAAEVGKVLHFIVFDTSDKYILRVSLSAELLSYPALLWALVQTIHQAVTKNLATELLSFWVKRSPWLKETTFSLQPLTFWGSHQPS